MNQQEINIILHEAHQDTLKVVHAAINEYVAQMNNVITQQIGTLGKQLIDVSMTHNTLMADAEKRQRELTERVVAIDQQVNAQASKWQDFVTEYLPKLDGRIVALEMARERIDNEIVELRDMRMKELEEWMENLQKATSLPKSPSMFEQEPLDGASKPA